MEIVIRQGNVADAEAFIQLLQEVREQMEHPEWFYLDPPELVRQRLDSGVMQLWVAMDGEKMAGALDVLIPGLEAYNYGYDLGFSEEALLQEANMDSAAVRPEYRGQGLQRQLLQKAEEALKMQKKGILLCTVHPDNRFSLDNVRRQGYAIQKKLEKYGSVRYILRKDIL